LQTPSRYADIDALEERIFHLVQAGEVRGAYHLFVDEFVEQATETQQYNRVCRVVKLFFKPEAKVTNQLLDALPNSLKPNLLMVWADAARSDGRDRDALSVCLEAADAARTMEKRLSPGTTDIIRSAKDICLSLARISHHPASARPPDLS
jgi:hypothetical protein